LLICLIISKASLCVYYPLVCLLVKVDLLQQGGSWFYRSSLAILKPFFLNLFLLILKIHLIYNFVIIDIQNKQIDFLMFFKFKASRHGFNNYPSRVLTCYCSKIHLLVSWKYFKVLDLWCFGLFVISKKEKYFYINVF